MLKRLPQEVCDVLFAEDESDPDAKVSHNAGNVILVLILKY